VKTKAISELDHQSELDSERVANWISERCLEGFAIFLIEAHLPLTSLLSTASIVGAPFIVPFASASRISQMQNFLDDREKLEALTSRLEQSLKDRAREKK